MGEYKKRVLLINSNNPYPNEGVNRYLPLGLLYLSSCLISNGYEVKVEDVQNNTMGLNRSEFDEYFEKTLLGIIESFKPDIVGIGVLFSLRFKSALSIIDLVKKVRSDLPIVIGGAHATLFPGPILHDHHKIDYCVLSEGEKSFPKLLNNHFDDHTAFSKIDGIAYRNNGQIQVNPKTQYIENLDEIEFPAYHLVNIEDYFFDTTNWHNPKSMDINYNFPLATSRSCPKRCSYCSLNLVHGGKYRTRSVSNVIEEIELLYHKYNCRYISFIDDNLTVLQERTVQLMNEICNRKLDIQFDTSNGIDITTFTEEMVDAMVQAGAIRFSVAIETGSEQLRMKVLNKKISNKRIYNFFEWTKKHKDLSLNAFLMIGFPQETHETLNETYKMIEALDQLDSVTISNLVPFYGTKIFDYCVENNLINVNLDSVHNDMTDLTYTKDVFLKPYNLEINDLTKFKENVQKFILARKNSR